MIKPLNNKLKSQVDAFLANFLYDNFQVGATDNRLSISDSQVSNSASYILDKKDFPAWYIKNQKVDIFRNIWQGEEIICFPVLIAAEFGSKYPNIRKSYPIFYLNNFITEIDSRPIIKEYVADKFPNVLNALNPSFLNNDILEGVMAWVAQSPDVEATLSSLVEKCTYIKNNSNLYNFYNQACSAIDRDTVDGVFAKYSLAVKKEPLFKLSEQSVDILDYTIENFIANNTKEIFTGQEYLGIVQNVVNAVNKSDKTHLIGIESAVHLNGKKSILLYTNESYDRARAADFITQIYQLAAEPQPLTPDVLSIIIEKVALTSTVSSKAKKPTLKI